MIDEPKSRYVIKNAAIYSEVWIHSPFARVYSDLIVCEGRGAEDVGMD